MNSHEIPDEVVFNFCTTILPDYRRIMKNLDALDQELSSHQMALHLMELGREQMSGVDDPGEQDVEFMSGYVESLDYDNAEEAFFNAFVGGCVMGLVIIKEVAREDFGRALRLIEDFAHKEFNSGAV